MTRSGLKARRNAAVRNAAIRNAMVLWLGLGVAWFGSAGLAAQETSDLTGEDSDAATARRGAASVDVLSAARWSGPISLDGRLDEAAWATAQVGTDFVQGEPTEGARPAEPTRVRVLFDDDAIYVGAEMIESDPARIRRQLVRRDERGAFDYFDVLLDPNRDGLTGYRFRVSAAGVQADAFLFNDTDEDEDWDAVWDAAVERHDRGWNVEMRIPLTQIRYESDPAVQTWGVNFARRRLASNSIDYFALESRTERGRVSQFGRLKGVEVSGVSRRFEVQPFIVSAYETAPVEDGNPLFDGTDFSPRTGADFSIGLGSAFSLDGTVNPDFGQVEVDPEVINLTAFETFFPEKRPFFVEDARVFDFTLSGHRNRLFFSRRIGRAPRGTAPDEAEFSRRPGETTILGAGKLSGRTRGGLSIGALAAVTQAEQGRAYFVDGDSIGRFPAEPTSGYGVLRLQQDFRGGASKVGAILTGVERDLPESGVFDDLPRRAYTGGIDFEHAWGGDRNRDWRLWGYFAQSYVQGDEEALLELQTNSNHFFQRPDATRVSVDSSATSMSGRDWRLQFERQSAEHWTWSVWLGEVTSGFEINDVGFSGSGERLDVGARVGYRNIEPGPLFRSYRLSLSTFHNFRHELFDDWDFGRAHRSGAFFASGNFEFHNNWDVEFRSFYSPQSQSDTQTRGGPLMLDPASYSLSVDLQTDRRAAVSLGPSLSYEKRYSGGGDEYSVGMDMQWRPASNWEIELGPRYSRNAVAAQFVTSTDDVPYTPTFGSRYLFGNLLRHSLSMETRVNAAFSPEVSLQVFVQPLVSSGEYLTYRQLERPQSFDFIDFVEGTALETAGGVECVGGSTCRIDDDRYFDFDSDGSADFDTSDRDFNIRSLRGNAVLRWEYRSGSQLFLVWQHSRRERADVGDFRVGRDLDGLLGAPAENAFILKLSHYLSF